MLRRGSSCRHRPIRGRLVCALGATLVSITGGCTWVGADFDFDALVPIDLSGDWRIVPDDPERPSNCLSIRQGVVVFYATRCGTTNDLVRVNETRAVDGSTLFVSLDARDGSNNIGRIEILARVVDANTLTGQVQVGNTGLGPSEVFDMTMIR